MNHVLVSDPNQRVALSIIRSLGEKGINVQAIERKAYAHPIGGVSRYCSNIHWIEDYERDREIIFKACEGAKLFIPVSINTIIFALRYAAEIRKRTRLILPPEFVLREANDKAWLMRFALSQGVPAPKTWGLLSESLAREMQFKISYPCVIKLQNDEGLFLGPEDRYGIVHRQEEFMDVYERLRQVKSSLLIQEFAEGESVGFCALYDESSQMRASFCHRRLREYPIAGGPSTLAESIRDENLVRYGKKLLDALKWVGPAMVEFKRHPKTGELKLLEINPRFWGMLPLAIEAGIDFPHLLHRLACGEAFEPVNHYRAGVRMRILFTDLLALKSEFSKSKEKVRVFAKAMGEYLNLAVKDGLLSCRDPKPVGRYLLNKFLRRQ